MKKKINDLRIRQHGTSETDNKKNSGFFSIKGGYNLYIKSNAGDCNNDICPGTNNGNCTNKTQCLGANLGTSCSNAGTC